MGRNAKIKKLRRAEKELDRIIDEGLATGKVIETEEGDIRFKDQETADKFFSLLFLHPPLMLDFVQNNPEFLHLMLEAISEDDEEDEDYEDEDD